MIQITCIVEGHGEVSSLPILLRRLVSWRSPGTAFSVNFPQRVPRDRLINRATELERHLKLAALKSGPHGWVLVLLDADDDCPATLGAHLLIRCRSILTSGPYVSVVLAKREFEAWFIAGAASLNGVRTFKMVAPELQIDPEQPRDAKGWLRQRMTSGVYDPVRDQPALVARVGLEEVHGRSRSFRKLCDEWDRVSARASAAQAQVQ